jgi:muconate cycloisomerase
VRVTLERIESFVVRVPGRTDWRWLSLSRPLGEFVLLRVQSEKAAGWGEVVALRDWGDSDGRRHGETPSTVSAVVHEQLAPALLGQPLALGELAPALDAAVVGHPYAKALVDIAMHDLIGRLLSIPVHELLGGQARASVPIAHMLGLMSVEEALVEARAALADGVRALQIKGGRDLSRDARLVRALREEHGPDIWLRVDANGGYRGRAAVRHALVTLAEAGADLVEQPVLGVDHLAQARIDAPLPLMADESCWSPGDALELVSKCAIDALSVYVGKAGGLARARQVCAIAAAAGVPHDVNGALELGIGNAANVHLALATPAELLPCVLPVTQAAGAPASRTGGRYFEDDVVQTSFVWIGGAVAELCGPGLGVEVDVERVERYCVERRVSPPTAKDDR